jgi:hypothetical protein
VGRLFRLLALADSDSWIFWIFSEKGPFMENAAFETAPATGQPSGAGIAYSHAPCKQLAPETSDQYPRVVAVFDAKRRVIECPAGLQWIIQEHKGGRWRSVSFCRTKEALLRLTGNPAVLQSLPDWFPEAQARLRRS